MIRTFNEIPSTNISIYQEWAGQHGDVFFFIYARKSPSETATDFNIRHSEKFCMVLCISEIAGEYLLEKSTWLLLWCATVWESVRTVASVANERCHYASTTPTWLTRGCGTESWRTVIWQHLVLRTLEMHVNTSCQCMQWTTIPLQTKMMCN